MDRRRYIVTDKVKCSACAKPIWKEQDRDYPAVEPELMPNVLDIDLHGGYGMFFDDPNGDYNLLLCHECAHKLVHSSPFLTHLLKGGHFHGFIYDEHGNLPQDNGGADCITDFYREWGAL